MNIRKKQLLLDRQALLEEISALQAENLRLRLPPPEPPPPDSPEEEAVARPSEFSRFPLLRAVDEKYENAGPGEPPQPPRVLPQVAEHLRRYAAAHFGLYANRQLFACFLGAMAASDFLLLRGQDALLLLRAVAAAWGQDIEVSAMRPGLDLLGEPDPVTKHYRETEFLRAVYEAGYREGVGFTVLEGIGAAPERCLSRLLPLLSLTHNPVNLARQISLADTAWPGDPVLLQNGALPWPGNLWLAGTLAPDAPAPSPSLHAAMEFCLPAWQAKPFLAPLQAPAVTHAKHLRSLFAHAREVYTLPEEALRLYALVERYLAEHMELSFGAQAPGQLRAFSSVCLACGLRPNEILDGFFYHKALRRLDRAESGVLKYELSGLRRFLIDTFGKRALPLTMKYLDELENAQ